MRTTASNLCTANLPNGLFNHDDDSTPCRHINLKGLAMSRRFYILSMIAGTPLILLLMALAAAAQAPDAPSFNPAGKAVAPADGPVLPDAPPVGVTPLPTADDSQNTFNQ